jgi:hypothetical protein
VAIREAAISTPGTTPARNSPPIDTVIRPPQTTMRMLGGMITPMTEEQAVIATVKLVA